LRDLLFWFSGAVLAASLVFGGATRQGLVSEAIPELMSLPLLALALPRAMPFLKSFPSALALVVGVIALPCLQLIPLPPELWKALPGRDFVAEILTAAQAPVSWRPISLIPSETWRALLSLLPAVAIFLAILSLGREARRRLLLVALAIGVASAVLGMLQVMGGGSRDLYLFAVTNEGTAVGFFANHNHLAALEYALLPLGAAALAETQTRSPAFLVAILGAVAPALLFGLTLTGSRSALILGGLSAAATLAFVLTPELTVLGRRRSLALIAAFALALLPIAIGFGFLNILTRFGKQDLAYLRDMIAANTWAGIKSYFPVGAGLGTFPSVYPLHERVADLIPDFVNRAHNDGLETLFEGGAGSLLLFLGFIAWLGASTYRVFVREDAVKGRQARAGVIAMALLLIHSLWDYPLRTIALETLFCFCGALQFAPPPPRSFRFRRGGQGEANRVAHNTRHLSVAKHASHGSWKLLAPGRSSLAGFHLLPTQETQDSVRAAWKQGLPS
jgi:O-antigen ligase